MRALALLALLPALAYAQFLPPRVSGASEGAATGGISSVASLGTCASPNAGTVVWLSPSQELRVCDGGAWRQAWTSREGVLPGPDRDVAAHTFLAQSPTGYAVRSLHNVPFDFGNGVNDECVSVGTAIRCGSFIIAGGQSLSVDVLAPTSPNTSLMVSTPGYLRIIPNGNTNCFASDSGGIQARAGDGNRPYWCDGTSAFRISRVLTVPVTFDSPAVPNGACVTASVTVAGAELGDTVSVNADFALPASIAIGNVRSTGADTVLLRLCNLDPTTAVDPDAGIYRFRLER